MILIAMTSFCARGNVVLKPDKIVPQTTIRGVRYLNGPLSSLDVRKGIS